MKTKLLSFVFPAVVYCACGFAFTAAAPRNAYALHNRELLEYFVESLTPYGRWTEVGHYGRVWEPFVRAGWRPYAHGHWMFSDEYGWVWQPVEVWGEIPFHYGRWTFVQSRWLWVPDDTWGPAWVDWRMNDDYIGWAPLPPDDDWEWEEVWHPRHAYVGDLPLAYIFVSQRHFCEPRLEGFLESSAMTPYLLSRSENITLYKTVNNHVWNEGPERGVVERHIGRPVERVRYAPHSILGHALPRPVVRDERRDEPMASMRRDFGAAHMAKEAAKLDERKRTHERSDEIVREHAENAARLKQRQSDEQKVREFVRKRESEARRNQGERELHRDPKHQASDKEFSRHDEGKNSRKSMNERHKNESDPGRERKSGNTKKHDQQSQHREDRTPRP